MLPNRGQRDEVLASDGVKILPLRQIVEPSRRPAGFSHGVPTELLEKCPGEARAEILFGQRFPRWEGKELLSISTPAGTDSSGRVVHLGLLFILEQGEKPRFDVPVIGLTKEDKAVATALIRRLTTIRHEDVWAESVRALLEVPFPASPTTNVELERSATHFLSLYTLGRGGLTRKHGQRGRLRTNLIGLLILAAIIAILCLRTASCARGRTTSVRGPGVFLRIEAFRASARTRALDSPLCGKVKVVPTDTAMIVTHSRDDQEGDPAEPENVRGIVSRGQPSPISTWHPPGLCSSTTRSDRPHTPPYARHSAPA